MPSLPSIPSILICSNMILAPDISLNTVDSVLVPNKCIVAQPEMYAVTCGARKNALEDVSTASLVLHAQNFAIATKKNVVPKFTSRPS